MASINGRSRPRVQKIQSGSRYLEAEGIPTPSVNFKILNQTVEAGWGCVLDRNLNAISTTSRPAMFGAFGPINKRYKNEKGELCQPVYLRGVIYTHRSDLMNAGDIKGNLMCLGTNGEDVDTGGVGEHRASRVVIIGKKRYRE